MNDKKTMTTAAGAPVGDNQNSLTVGPRGPVLMQDLQLTEKMAHFNRERIPERVVHAKGSGAHGVFEVTGDVTKWTKARLFESVGKKTEVFVRFSTVGGEKDPGYGTRSARIRREVLHRRRQLGHGREQYSRLLHPRWDKVL